MKKAGLSVSLFLAAFVLVYAGSCYFVPGWRIKLEADRLTYFLESLKNLAPVKGMISLAAGLAVSFIPTLLQKMRSDAD